MSTTETIDHAALQEKANQLFGKLRRGVRIYIVEACDDVLVACDYVVASRQVVNGVPFVQARPVLGAAVLGDLKDFALDTLVGGNHVFLTLGEAASRASELNSK